MHRTILALMAFCSAAGAAHADTRFFCSADDKDVRFTVESGFEAGGGHKLNHFRGALVVKSGDIPQALKKIAVNSENLTHHWSHDGELRLEVFYDGGDDARGQGLSLVVTAGQRGKSMTAFSGTYELAIEGGVKPLAASGKVSCGSK
ncbi:hypothetical protein J2W42_001188 [Rhizobium tibeticum]|uniref:Uncharacterized protein n=1 Tax=Rhizobium tibeticum TaxID=501024 RepID=A0A1H8CJU3_9HYPH|nr:hypothetical protein [Rhizobium tibeticum]MDP9808350.1 hypothetical protein [Rhizobium tibeticum]SEH48149.1 hypothetical protein RTCCBAU85039_0640 [Rhizobium tibeticum]SEM95383.1 hypothetical protein SAMN05216228_1001192 [Rhizobium tibeticum]